MSFRDLIDPSSGVAFEVALREDPDFFRVTPKPKRTGRSAMTLRCIGDLLSGGIRP